MINELMKSMVAKVMRGGATKKVATAVVPKTADITNTQVFFTVFLLSIANYLVRAFIFMIVLNALVPRIKEMHPQMREVTFGESILFVILFSVIFQ